MLRIITIIVLIFCSNATYSQEQNIFRAIVWRGDTIAHLMLREVTVIGRTRSNAWYRRQERRDSRLEYNVRKVYPYARMAARKVNEIENKLTHIAKEADRKKVLKEEYNELMKDFKGPLTKLSINQGRILIRLIYRETSHTSFAHIREYRGTVNAYFWQSIALIFGNNLKAAYDPRGEDAAIEEIVQRILRGE